VLQALLRERVSIRDLAPVLEAMADTAAVSKELEVVVERVRQRLARSLTKQHLESDGHLYCFTLHPGVEQAIVDSVQRTDAGIQLALEPTLRQQLLEAVRRQAERMVAAGHQPLALCAPRVRGALRTLAQEAVPTLVVLSYSEVVPGVPVEALGMLTKNHEDSTV
jgi:flagellar biosynthesis protein FlhA